jgi:hypothetical protein
MSDYTGLMRRRNLRRVAEYSKVLFEVANNIFGTKWARSRRTSWQTSAMLLEARPLPWSRGDGGRSVSPLALRPSFSCRSGAILLSWLALEQRGPQIRALFDYTSPRKTRSTPCAPRRTGRASGTAPCRRSAIASSWASSAATASKRPWRSIPSRQSRNDRKARQLNLVVRRGAADSLHSGKHQCSGGYSFGAGCDRVSSANVPDELSALRRSCPSACRHRFERRQMQ